MKKWIWHIMTLAGAALIPLAVAALGTAPGPSSDVVTLHAHSAAYGDIESVAGDFPLIVVGKVARRLETRVHHLLPQEYPPLMRLQMLNAVSRYEITPTEMLKGSLPDAGPVFFSQPGGKIAGLGTQVIEHEELLVPGTEYVFFMEPVSGLDGFQTHIGQHIRIVGAKAYPSSLGLLFRAPMDTAEVMAEAGGRAGMR